MPAVAPKVDTASEFRLVLALPLSVGWPNSGTKIKTKEEGHMSDGVLTAQMNEPWTDGCIDRRQVRPFRIFYGGIRGGRPFGRRASDAEGNYLAWHESPLLYATIATLLLCATDAILTLQILSRGGTELNWFMDVLLAKDVSLFAAVKMSISGVALVVLVAHANFRVFRVRVEHLVYSIVPVYGLLVVYELFLLSLI